MSASGVGFVWGRPLREAHTGRPRGLCFGIRPRILCVSASPEGLGGRIGRADSSPGARVLGTGGVPKAPPTKNAKKICPYRTVFTLPDQLRGTKKKRAQ